MIIGGGVMVQFRGFQVHIWGFSVHFVWFSSDVSWDFFQCIAGSHFHLMLFFVHIACRRWLFWDWKYDTNAYRWGGGGLALGG